MREIFEAHTVWKLVRIGGDVEMFHVKHFPTQPILKGIILMEAY